MKWVKYADTGEQLRALGDGQLHVTAFGTGAVPSAVNESGFVPLACFADADGNYGYRMKIIVPADSKHQEVSEIRGQRMTFTRPRSNSGYKAALAMLLAEHELQPERDYAWGFSYGHEKSITGIAAGEFEFASVASDLLDGMIAQGDIAADSIRTIYESESFPPGVFGYAHRLTPQLREGVRRALLELSLEGTEIQSRYGGGTAARLAEVDYQADWEPVRKVDDAVRGARQQYVANGL